MNWPICKNHPENCILRKLLSSFQISLSCPNRLYIPTLKFLINVKTNKKNNKQMPIFHQNLKFYRTIYKIIIFTYIKILITSFFYIKLFNFKEIKLIIFKA